MTAEARYFACSEDFGAWLAAHGATQRELLVGFHKVGSGQASMTWSASVDEALCHGWIDGVRKRVDEARYTIRFSPRKPSSIWSAVNIAKVAQLRAQGRMTPAGERAFAARTAARSVVYSYEQAGAATLSPDEQRQFQANRAAWAYFEATPPGYRQQMLHRITTAKRAATRASRLARLVEACAAGRRLG